MADHVALFAVHLNFRCPMTNDDIARRLRQHARDLAGRGDNLYRVRAFRQAAMAVLELREPLAEVVARTGSVPGVGASVAELVSAFVRTGTWSAEKPSTVAPKTPTGGTDCSVSPVEFASESVA